MDYLGEEAKNLGARLGKTGVLDKKIERGIRNELMAKFKTEVDTWVESTSDNSPTDCRKAVYHLLNYLSVRQDCYLGFSADESVESVVGWEWTIRLMTNVAQVGEDKETSLELLNELYGQSAGEVVDSGKVRDIVLSLL